MTVPPIPSNEQSRIEALHALEILDTPIEDRFERITRLAKRLLCVPIAAISLVDRDRQWFKSMQGTNVCETSREISFCGHAIIQNEMMAVVDARLDPRFADNPLVTGEPSIVFYAGIPIHSVDGHTVGTLCVIDRKPRRLSLEDQQILRDLAALAESELSAAVAAPVQADLLSQLVAEHRKGMIDSLTRVWNREGMEELLVREWAAARTGLHGLAALMIDVDEFKQVNDRLGHAAGDEVLRQVAKRILSAIRAEDTLGRMSGDEFLVLLSPFSVEKDELKVAERIRVRVCETPILTGPTSVTVRVSIGAAQADRSGATSISALLAAADKALYRAKHNGRNCVASSVPAQQNAA